MTPMPHTVTLIGIAIFLLALRGMWMLESKYRDPMEGGSFEDLLGRFNIEDLIKLRYFSVQGFIGLCLTTIGTLMK